MYLWIFFALLAPLLWACGNVLDNAIRRNFVKSDLALTFFSALSRLPFAVLLFIFSPFETPSLLTTILIVTAGMLWTIPYFFYYRALNEDETTRIALMMQTMLPIFLLLIAFSTIHERLTVEQTIGFAFLLFGGIFAAMKKLEGVWRFSRAFFLIAGATFLWALSDVVFKHSAAAFSNFWSAFMLYLFASSIPAMIKMTLPGGRRLIQKYFSSLPRKTWVMLIATQLCGTVGSAAFAYALTIGKASLTGVLSGTQPLFVLLWALLLFPFLREIPREDFSRISIVFKTASFLLIIVGLWFISV